MGDAISVVPISMVVWVWLVMLPTWLSSRRAAAPSLQAVEERRHGRYGAAL
jgi:hypothetical protein